MLSRKGASRRLKFSPVFQPSEIDNTSTQRRLHTSHLPGPATLIKWPSPLKPDCNKVKARPQTRRREIEPPITAMLPNCYSWIITWGIGVRNQGLGENPGIRGSEG